MNATRPKSIQIDYSFFLDLISYAFMHEDSEDPAYERIICAFQRKLAAMERHNFYSLYKSGASEDIRRKAREEYLKVIGLPDAFRWKDGQDVNVTHEPNALLPNCDAIRRADL